MKLFAKATKTQSNSASAVGTNEALQRLKETAALVEKREQYLEKQIRADVNMARKLATSNRRSALMALKRKKMREAQVEQLGNTRFALEQQILTLEGVGVSVDVMQSLRAGATAMQLAHNNMKPDDIADVMEEVNDQMALAAEVGTALAEPLGNFALFDDDELASELDALEQETLNEQFSKPSGERQQSSHSHDIDIALRLPDIPAAVLPSQKPAAAAAARIAVLTNNDDLDDIAALKEGMQSRV
jgi:charged multivesicular body protein 4